jgi:hypothetical protein
MGILNRPSDGQASVLVAMLHTLRAYGPSSEDRLLSLCAPSTLVAAKKPTDTQVHKTLLRWTQLGAFEEKGTSTDPEYHLDRVFDGVDLNDLETLSSVLRGLVFKRENNPLDGRDTEAESGDASDFSLAAGWVLQQNPYSFPNQSEDVKALESAQRRQATAAFFSNNTRWDGFKDWASFFGLAQLRGKLGFIPNPVDAVRATLPAIFGPAQSSTIGQFLAGIAEHLPVLDGGDYCQAAATRIANPWRGLAPGEISPCLSLAILQLEREGRLQLVHSSDGEVHRLLGRQGGALSQVTHVSFSRRNS